jgi:histidinol-phosphate aminotransferase
MSDFRFSCLVDELSATVPFVGPEHLERRSGVGFKARIGANESVFGPSEAVLQQIEESKGLVWQYGDPELSDLRSELSGFLDVDINEVVVGEGIDALLGYICRLFIDYGDVVTTSDGTYPTFNFHAAGYGARIELIPYRNDRADLSSLVESTESKHAKLVYLANPDNPMGTIWSAQDINDFITAVPSSTVVLLDEAYGEFASEDLLPPLDTSRSNVIRFRTFSKAYGLAGLRIGYAIGHKDLIREFEKIRNHFGVGKLSQIAALAALKDQGYLTKVLGLVEKSRQKIYEIAKDNGLLAIRSHTNFVSIDCGSNGDYARRVLASLIRMGVFVRMPTVSPLDRCIRVTCGTESDLDLLARCLPDALIEARS